MILNSFSSRRSGGRLMAHWKSLEPISRQVYYAKFFALCKFVWNLMDLVSIKVETFEVSEVLDTFREVAESCESQSSRR